MSRFFHQHKRQLAVFAFFVLACSLLPIADVYHAVGDGWQGVPQVYTDEEYYYARITEVTDGHPFLGNPYFYEHRADFAPTFFVPDWLAAVPLLLGADLPTALFGNLFLWSFIFIALSFAVFLELRLNKNAAALGAFLLYIQSYLWILRPVSLQQVFPFFLLFLLAALRWYRAPEKKTAKIFLAFAAAAPFYVYAYLWQIVAAAFLVLVTALLACRDWRHLKNLVFPSAVGMLLALPALVYTVVQMAHLFYWQTAERISLVYTHLPTAEVLYSGGWVIVVLAVFFFMRKRTAPADRPALAILSVVGLAMLGTQMSNLITGKEAETALHVKHFIAPWLGVSLGALIAWFARSASDLARQKMVRAAILAAIFLLGAVNIHFIPNFRNFFMDPARDARMQRLQAVAAPLRYLENAEDNPVVVWVMNAESDLAYYVPVLTKHYVLYSHPGMWHLVSNDEIMERYLMAQYPKPVSKETLIAGLGAYAGPAAFAHRANTVNRGVRLCRLFRIDTLGYPCGELITPEELLGEAYFDAIIRYNEIEVRPQARELLAKYRVSYIASSEPLSPALEHLFGAELVYHDQQYLIYRLARP